METGRGMPTTCREEESLDDKPSADHARRAGSATSRRLPRPRPRSSRGRWGPWGRRRRGAGRGRWRHRRHWGRRRRQRGRRLRILRLPALVPALQVEQVRQVREVGQVAGQPSSWLLLGICARLAGRWRPTEQGAQRPVALAQLLGRVEQPERGRIPGRVRPHSREGFCDCVHAAVPNGLADGLPALRTPPRAELPGREAAEVEVVAAGHHRETAVHGRLGAEPAAHDVRELARQRRPACCWPTAALWPTRAAGSTKILSPTDSGTAPSLPTKRSFSQVPLLDSSLSSRRAGSPPEPPCGCTEKWCSETRWSCRTMLLDGPRPQLTPAAPSSKCERRKSKVTGA